VRVLVDSNVIFDILTEDAQWFSWSAETLAHHAESDILTINPIILAEVSGQFSTIEEADEVLAETQFVREDLPWEAAFLAGHCFIRYRRSGGLHRSPLPDFYIGAHAAVRGMALITRDPRRYRTHFPRLQIICPEK
jgi:predicted nucleic acid-binding protein